MSSLLPSQTTCTKRNSSGTKGCSIWRRERLLVISQLLSGNLRFQDKYDFSNLVQIITSHAHFIPLNLKPELRKVTSFKLDYRTRIQTRTRSAV